MKRLIFIALGAIALSAAAQAQVIYRFSGFDGGGLTDGTANNPVSFEYESASLVASSDPISASLLSQCSAGPGRQCAQVTFITDTSSMTSVPGFQALGFGSLQPDGSVMQYFYYFASPAFGAPGSYVASAIGNPGTLTISVVPEPSQALLLGLGLVPLLLRLRARRRVSAV